MRPLPLRDGARPNWSSILDPRQQCETRFVSTTHTFESGLSSRAGGDKRALAAKQAIAQLEEVVGLSAITFRIQMI